MANHIHMLTHATVTSSVAAISHTVTPTSYSVALRRTNDRGKDKEICEKPSK